jgi:hypothetical protein
VLDELGGVPDDDHRPAVAREALHAHVAAGNHEARTSVAGQDVGIRAERPCAATGEPTAVGSQRQIVELGEVASLPGRRVEPHHLEVVDEEESCRGLAQVMFCRQHPGDEYTGMPVFVPSLVRAHRRYLGCGDPEAEGEGEATRATEEGRSQAAAGAGRRAAGEQRRRVGDRVRGPRRRLRRDDCADELGSLSAGRPAAPLAPRRGRLRNGAARRRWCFEPQ